MDTCIKCGLPAKFECGRCQERYCSKNCQREDWRIHHHACFVMPDLVPIQSNLESGPNDMNDIEAPDTVKADECSLIEVRKRLIEKGNMNDAEENNINKTAERSMSEHGKTKVSDHARDFPGNRSMKDDQRNVNLTKEWSQSVEENSNMNEPKEQTEKVERKSNMNNAKEPAISFLEKRKMNDPNDTEQEKKNVQGQFKVDNALAQHNLNAIDPDNNEAIEVLYGKEPKFLSNLFHADKRTLQKVTCLNKTETSEIKKNFEMQPTKNNEDANDNNNFQGKRNADQSYVKKAGEEAKNFQEKTNRHDAQGKKKGAGTPNKNFQGKSNVGQRYMNEAGGVQNKHFQEKRDINVGRRNINEAKDKNIEDDKPIYVETKIEIKKPVGWKVPYTPPKNKYYEVNVHFIESEDPLVLWVVEVKNIPLLLEMLDEINRSGSSLSVCKTEDIYVGALVAAPLSPLLYRAKILEVDYKLEKAMILFLDYGDVAKVEFHEIYKPLPIMTNLNVFTFRIQSVKNLSALPVVESKICIRVVGSNNGLLQAEIKPSGFREEQRADNNSTTLNTFETSIVKKTQPSLGLFKAMKAVMINTLKDLEIIPLPEGPNMSMIMLDASTISKGFVTATDYHKDTTKVHSNYLANVSKYCKSHPQFRDYAPRLNELCLAIFDEDGEWYRGVCTEIEDEKLFKVMFIDYGNCSKINSKCVMPIPKELMFPLFSHACLVENVVPPEKYITFANSFAETAHTQADVKKNENGDYVIKLLELEKRLG